MNPTQSTTSIRLVYAVDEHPPEWMSVFLGMQLVLLIITPITITPLVLARAAGIDSGQHAWMIFAALIASAIGSFIQIHRFGRIGSGYLLFIGSSAAFMACALTAAQIGGMALVATLTILSAPLQLLFGWFLGPLRRVFTPLVGGVVIMLIVVSALGIALNLMTGQGNNAPAMHNLWVSGGTLLIILSLIIFGSNTLRVWSLFIGLCSGSLLAMGFGLFDISSIQASSWIGLPQFAWQGISLDFGPEFLSLLLAFAIVTVVGGVETLGDAMAIQHISERNFRKINYERVQGAIYADGISNAIAGALGTIPNTTYSNAIAAVELTGVTARRVGYYSVICMLLLAFSPKLAALIMAIPAPVIGAFLFVLLSMLFVTGLKLAASEGLGYHSGVIIGVSFWLGFACHNQLLFADLIPAFLAPFLGNGMAAGGLVAILLSLLFTLRPAEQARITLKRDVSDLVRLQHFIHEYASGRSLSPALQQKLHLTAEELFMELCRSIYFTAPHLAMLIRREDRVLQVEFIDSSSTRDMDQAIENLPAKPEEIDPDQLGLLILGRYADNIKHITIGGVNYISYRLSD